MYGTTSATPNNCTFFLVYLVANVINLRIGIGLLQRLPFAISPDWPFALPDVARPSPQYAPGKQSMK